MKIVLAALALSAALVPAAFATEPTLAYLPYGPSVAKSDNTATLGAQFNQQFGHFNGADNRAGIAQSGLGMAPTVFPYGGTATTRNHATIGAQVNLQEGAFNRATNDAWIDQRGRSFAGGPGYADATNTASIGAQLNIQSGYGNSASNSAKIIQSSDAVTE
jgi:hypothetical protein